MKGSVYKRGSTWSYQFTTPGPPRKHHSKGGFRTKREAQAALDEALAACGDGRMPPGQPWTVNVAGPYVYVLLDAERTPVYVGRSTQILTRLHTHFGRRHKLTGQFAYIDLYPCADDFHMIELEATLIRRHQPKFNVEGIRQRSATRGPANLTLAGKWRPG